MLRHVIALSVSALIAAYGWQAVRTNAGALLLLFTTHRGQRLMSDYELSQYNGEEGSPGLYLSLLGHVFDVSRGRRHYGPGGGYHFFAGRDASRAFVTGDFTPTGLTDDVTGLSPAQIISLYDWLDFYKKDYTPVGKLMGRHYSQSGEPTEALLQTETLLAQGLQLKAQAQAERKSSPPCNSEWSSAGDGRVWCSTKSGGVHRNWSGVPRKLFSPGSSNPRCVCVDDNDPSSLNNPNLQEFEACPPLAESCIVRQV